LDRPDGRSNWDRCERCGGDGLEVIGDLAERAWRCLYVRAGTAERADLQRHVDPVSVRIGLNSAQPQIELLQPIAGPSLYHDWQQAHSEGVHHLAIHVESLDAAIDSMRDAGLELLQLGRGFGVDGDGGFAYFDTEHLLGVVLEAIELPARRREPELVIS
jgi:hypothetical protein